MAPTCLGEVPSHGATSCPQCVPPLLGTSGQWVALLGHLGGEKGG